MSDHAPDRVFHLRNVLLLMGVLVATIGTVYFATEIRTRISDGGRVVALLLLAFVYGGLAQHFDATGITGPAVDKDGWRWLRPTTLLFLLALLATVTSLFVFLSIDGIDRLMKAAVAILLGLALIVYGATKLPHDGQDTHADPGEGRERPPGT